MFSWRVSFWLVVPELRHYVEQDQDPDCPRYAAEEPARSPVHYRISAQYNTPLQFAVFLELEPSAVCLPTL
jgi:hypothetical protein